MLMSRSQVIPIAASIQVSIAFHHRICRNACSHLPAFRLKILQYTEASRQRLLQLAALSGLCPGLWSGIQLICGCPVALNECVRLCCQIIRVLPPAHVQPLCEEVRSWSIAYSRSQYTSEREQLPKSSRVYPPAAACVTGIWQRQLQTLSGSVMLRPGMLGRGSQVAPDTERC